MWCSCIAHGYGVVLQSMRLQVRLLAARVTFRLGWNSKTVMGIQCVPTYSSKDNYWKGQLDTKTWDQQCFICHHLLQIVVSDFLLGLLPWIMQNWISLITNYLQNCLKLAWQIASLIRKHHVRCFQFTAYSIGIFLQCFKVVVQFMNNGVNWVHPHASLRLQ